jgi:hypothetical protein
MVPSARGRLKASRTVPQPARDSAVFRSLAVGGRANHWGRMALRFSAVDFHAMARAMIGSVLLTPKSLYVITVAEDRSTARGEHEVVYLAGHRLREVRPNSRLLLGSCSNCPLRGTTPHTNLPLCCTLRPTCHS